jgi:hypothetical protein
MRSFPITWCLVTRRGWLIVASTVLGLGTAWALSGIAVSATSAFSVRTIGRHQPPYERDRLALTYAQLLPAEPALIGAVSRATHLPPAYVRGHLTMAAVPETSILKARFTAASGNTALAGLRGLAAGLESGTDSTGASLRNTVRPVTSPTVGGGMSREQAVSIGLLAGLVVGLTLAVALERRYPRVDGRDALAQILAIPVSQVGRHTRRDAFPFPVALRRGEGAKVIATDHAAPAEKSTDGASGVLVVAKGAHVSDVEEALRSGAASGVSVARAIFLRRTPVSER